MSAKLTVRWDDPRIEAKEDKYDTLSDYVRSAIVRDRFLAGDKDARKLAGENVLKWWREKGFFKNIRLVLE
jgi:Arc/MetJ-type ribon-helix-helix transcriptional regulator